jgi:hypothetical protein
MWPRRKNTRGGEEEDEDDEEGMATETEARSPRSPSRKRRASVSDGKTEERRQALKDISNDGSLEMRMAAEGRNLRAATGAADEDATGSAASTTARSSAEGSIKRSKAPRNKNSTEDLRMPGRFD